MNKRITMMITMLVVLLGLVPAVWAQAGATGGVTVVMSQETAVLTAGDWVEFTTTLHNEGTTATPPLVAHLSLAPISSTRAVDPEDWMPQRTQNLPSIQPGESTQISWKVHALFEGEFSSYVTVLATDGSLPLVASDALQMQVSPDDILPLQDVIPVAAVVPFFPLALLAFSVTKMRRRK